MKLTAGVMCFGKDNGSRLQLQRQSELASQSPPCAGLLNKLQQVVGGWVRQPRAGFRAFGRGSELGLPEVRGLDCWSSWLTGKCLFMQFLVPLCCLSPPHPHTQWSRGPQMKTLDGGLRAVLQVGILPFCIKCGRWHSRHLAGKEQKADGVRN